MTVKISCTKLRAGDQIQLYWDSTDNGAFKTFEASSAGTGSGSFKVPDAKSGTHKVLIRGSSGLKLSVNVTVKPGIALSPKTGPAKTKITVTVKGAKAGETFDIKWYSTSSKSSILRRAVVASAVGTLKTTITVPSTATVGNHKVEAVGSAGTKISATFAVSAVASASIDGPAEVAGSSGTSDAAETALISDSAVGLPFVDGFERGDTAAWSESSGVTISGEIVGAGSLSALLIGNQSPALLVQAIAGAPTDLYVLAEFYLQSHQGVVNLIQIKAPNGSSLATLSIGSSGRLAIRNDVTKNRVSSPVRLGLGEWHEIEVHLRTGSDGVIDVWFDGASMGALTSDGAFSDGGVGFVAIGDSSSSHQFILAVDSVVMDRNFVPLNWTPEPERAALTESATRTPDPSPTPSAVPTLVPTPTSTVEPAFTETPLPTESPMPTSTEVPIESPTEVTTESPPAEVPTAAPPDP